jgi:hypothetical protein
LFTTLCVWSFAFVAIGEGLEARVEELERKIEAADEQESPPPSLSSRIPKWVERFHISGNADFSYLYGEHNSFADDGRFAVENTRLFLDVDLGGEVRLFDTTILDAASFYFEWDLVREASLKNKVGSLYARVDGLGGSDTFNLKFGRMPIPFGEEYLRFHEQRPKNPLISYSAPSPYNWDEGLMVFGSFRDKKVTYQLAVTDADDDFNVNSHPEPQVTLKVAFDPTSWLHASVSGLRTGRLGGDDFGEAAESAIEWGGTHAEPLGIGGVPTYRDGAISTPDPSPRLDDVLAWEADLILDRPIYGRLWVAFGQVFIESATSNFYDRDFSYWIAEGVFELGCLNDMLDRFYVAARYSGMSTFDDDEGYSFAAMVGGEELGFNTKQVELVSAGIGVRLTEQIVVKTEYTYVDFETVRGVDPAIQDAAKERDYYGVELTLGF